MRSFLLLQALALSALQPAWSTPLQTRNGPNCQNITFPVTISSKNAQLPSNLDSSSRLLQSLLTGLFSLVFDTLVEGTFTIAGSYCEPEVHIASRASTLQLLVHGATYNRNYVSMHS
jgi:hypothetical protein